ncbi:hypothetical protein ABT063_03750 [Streptomyces sp. NPDC002838]|uniref:hypothetical protein n=1 Tax=Streptomyces sp. NPDC002838 TaxID=3154436 RepID=UPI0033189875
MGLDITVLAVDWGQLGRTPAGEREELLWEAAYPGDDIDLDAEPEVGWVFPASPKVPWSGRYEFRDTLGLYKAHFWAADGWDTVREYAAPALRLPLDGFLRGLIWAGADPDDEDALSEAGLFPSDSEPWRPRLLLACPPPAVPGLAAHWARAEPLFEGLRETYDAHCSRPGRWIADYDEFAALVRQWAVVVDETARRGWGLLGLPI